MLRLPLFFGLVFGAVLTAAGQMAITVNRTDIVGEVVQASPRGVVVKAGDGKNWMLPIGKATRVFKITGTAVPEMITPRTYVRFIASIDKKTCKAQDKIDKVTIFTPTPNTPSRTPGMELAKDVKDDADDAGPGFPPRGPPGRGRPMPGQVPPGQMPPGQGPAGQGPAGQGPAGQGPAGQGPAGQGPAGQGPAGQRPPAAQDAGGDALLGASDAGDDAAPGPKNKRRGGKNPAASTPEVASYEVCAQVQSFHGRRLTVVVQNRFMKSRIMAELTPDAEIALDLADMSLVKPGDKVTATGLYAKPGICLETEKLVITLSDVVGARGNRNRRAKPKAEAAHHPPAKAKPDAAGAEAEKKPVPAKKPSDDDVFGAPADDKAQPAPAEQPPAAPDFPKEKDGDSVMDDPNAKSDPAPAPKADEAKPDAKKPADGGAKPPVKDDEKDVFEK